MPNADKKICSVQRLPFIRAICALLTYCPALADPMLPSRLARAVLPVLTSLLALQSQAQREDDTNANSAKSRKGKKRARGYEGDEVFQNREIICSTKEDGEVVLLALDGKLLSSILHKSRV